MDALRPDGLGAGLLSLLSMPLSMEESGRKLFMVWPKDGEKLGDL